LHIRLFEEKQKFYSIFFKKLRFPKAEPLVAHRNERNTLAFKLLLSSQKELCSVATGNFAQSFMGKKSKLQIENRFSICFSVREKHPLEMDGMHFPEKPPGGRFFCWMY
jgi:hypothetical protein